MLSRGLNVLFGVEAGGEGKGKVAAWLADSGLVDIACCDFTPAVSYSAQFDSTEQFAVSQVPMAAAVRSTRGAPLPHLAILLPTAVIHPETLLMEVEHYGLADRLLIDSRCAVVEDRHRAPDVVAEARTAREGMRLSARSALADVVRSYDTDDAFPNVAAEYPELAQWVVEDVTKTVRSMAADGKRVLLEMGNGFDQSLHFGSRSLVGTDTTVGAALNAAGCPAELLGEVIAVVNGGTPTEQLGRLLERCWRINKPSQVVVNFTDQMTPGLEDFLAVTQLGIATGAVWTSGNISPESIRRW